VSSASRLWAGLEQRRLVAARRAHTSLEEEAGVKAQATIDPGTCGFVATVTATVRGGRTTSFTIESSCDHVRQLAAALAEKGPFDVYDEMDWNRESRLRVTIREGLKGSYAWCPVPLGLMKAMQVAAGLSLPETMGLTLGGASEESGAGGTP
jgi:hypothetical protein